MRWKSHVRFGRRAAETDQSKDRHRAAARPHTYVSTWSGWCYTAFVIDAYARRIVGWSVATTMTSQLVVDAVDQAVWTRHRDGRDLTGLIAHHDHGVNTSRLPTASSSTSPGSNPRPGPSAHRSTTPSPRQSTASTRPS
jgi:transposase InsO family protein